MSRYASHIVEYNENGKWVPLTFYRKGKKSMEEKPIRSFLSSMSKVLSFIMTYRKRKKAFGETELNLLKDVKYFYRAINGYSDSPKLNVINLGSDNVLREDMILSFTDLRIRDYILSEPDDIMIGRGYPKDMNKLTKKFTDYYEGYSKTNFTLSELQIKISELKTKLELLSNKRKKSEDYEIEELKDIIDGYERLYYCVSGLMDEIIGGYIAEERVRILTFIS